MKTEVIQTLTTTFESHAQRTENGVEFWLARDLQHLLGYAEWRNFGIVLNKAKSACELVGHPIKDHFVDVNKMVDLDSGSKHWTTRAPKGRKLIAQGNALGQRMRCYPSPVRAQQVDAGHYSDQIERAFAKSALNVPPLQGLRADVHHSQGAALGYLMLPLCGKELSYSALDRSKA